MSAQQELDQRFAQAVEAAKAEILAGLPLIEYLRRTGDEDVDGWAALLAQFGEEGREQVSDAQIGMAKTA